MISTILRGIYDILRFLFCTIGGLIIIICKCCPYFIYICKDSGLLKALKYMLEHMVFQFRSKLICIVFTMFLIHLMLADILSLANKDLVLLEYVKNILIVSLSDLE